MASSGPNNPTSAVERFAAGTGWTSLSNLYASDDSRASASLSGTGGGSQTNYIDVTGFGFSIPAGATIDGVIVEIERSVSSTSGSPTDRSVFLLADGRIGTDPKVGDDKATLTIWPTTDAYATYGGAADAWAASLTDTQVNNSNFGVCISGRKTSGETSTTLRIDHVKITIHYTASGGGGGVAKSSLQVRQAVNRASRY